MEIFTDFPHAVGVDVTHRCLLQCPRCLRVRQPELIKAGKDITIDEFTKLCKHFESVTLCGQISDSIYHPKFFDLLNVAKESGVRLAVSTNGSGKKQKFWDTIWNDYAPLNWTFALDGLPKDSHKYRINQNGEAVWEIMKQGAAAGHHITWQYIIFKYNENDIATAMKMAKEHGMRFNLLRSNRWNGPDGEEDIYKPTKETHLLPIDDPNELATDEEFFPKCVNVNRKKSLTYTNEGFMLPCCWTDRLKDFEHLKQDHLKVSNVEKIEDILMSDEWQTFYQNILEKNSNVSNMCRMKCRSGKKNKTSISFNSGIVDVYEG